MLRRGGLSDENESEPALLLSSFHFENNQPFGSEENGRKSFFSRVGRSVGVRGGGGSRPSPVDPVYSSSSRCVNELSSTLGYEIHWAAGREGDHGEFPPNLVDKLRILFPHGQSSWGGGVGCILLASQNT